GLKVVDDTTFTVELKQPESDWPLRLGYTAFMPVPSAALADPKSYGEKPVGNGPYKMAETGWQHNVQISLVPNPDYNGPRKAKNGGITFKIYQ
ncbi:ABC transporter substrate-binding protein, partial [Burkholderia sp. SIMBA_045]